MRRTWNILKMIFDLSQLIFDLPSVVSMLALILVEHWPSWLRPFSLYQSGERRRFVVWISPFRLLSHSLWSVREQPLWVFFSARSCRSLEIKGAARKSVRNHYEIRDVLNVSVASQAISHWFSNSAFDVSLFFVIISEVSRIPLKYPGIPLRNNQNRRERHRIPQGYLVRVLYRTQPTRIPARLQQWAGETSHHVGATVSGFMCSLFNLLGLKII